MNELTQTGNPASTPPIRPSIPNLEMTKQEIVLTRIFDAPRERVFKAWTDPDQLRRWWAPLGCETSGCKVELRPGGAFHYGMRMANGQEIWGKGIYRDVVAPERLCFVDAFADAEGNVVGPEHYGMSIGHPRETLVSIAFSPRENHERTEVTLRQPLSVDVPERADVAKGWMEMFDRLAEHLASSSGEAFLFTHAFDAPRDLVFRAWTDRDFLMRWWGPKGYEMQSAELDLRPGGVFHYALRSPDGGHMWGKFVYCEIVPPERLVYINSFADKHGSVLRHPFSPEWPLELINTLTLQERDGGTILQGRTVPLNATEAERRAFMANHASLLKGLMGSFEQLEIELRRAREH